MTVYLHNQKLFLAVIVAAVIGSTVLWLQLTSYPILTMPSWSPAEKEVTQFPSRLLPYAYWKHRKLYPEKYNQISCNRFPRLEDIHYAAASWQHLQVKNGNVYVYGAYWDSRFGQPLVRVLVYCDVAPLPRLMCQLWYENVNAPVTVPLTVTYGWRTYWKGPIDGVNEPYILTCSARRHPPDKQRAPAAVSIVREGDLCRTPTNVLNVQGAPLFDAPAPTLNTTKISVCLKWLHFEDDISAELVEWIELLKAFGADKLFVFLVQAHPNSRLVLDYYQAAGFADVTEFVNPPQLRSTFEPSQQNFHDFRRELLPLNDCLYRSLNKYQWLTPTDSDEIIVPQNYTTWQQVISAETKNSHGLDEMVFQNYYFLDPAQRDLAAPPHMKILGHLWRAREANIPGYNVKSFHNASSVVAMHNHHPISCGASRRCLSRNVNESVARLHHYRARCNGDVQDCRAMHDVVRDDTITKWKHVIADVDRVLSTLGIKPKDQNKANTLTAPH